MEANEVRFFPHEVCFGFLTMAKILLIKCSHLTDYMKNITFPLGLMYISSMLREKGHEVKIVDLRLYENNHVLLLTQAVKEFQPDIVGLSAITVEASSLHSTASLVKSILPHTTIIAGGPHPTSFPREVLNDPNITYVVLGEGEETSIELVDCIQKRKNVAAAKGIAYRNNIGLCFAEQRPFVENPDYLPFPAWDLVEIERYWEHDGMANVGVRKYMNIFTSRACPYKCIYCHNIFGKGYRTRTPENVVKEIHTLIKVYGIREFDILDDVFNLDRNRTKRICELILENNLEVHFSLPNGVRTDIMDEELLKLMKKAGLTHISIAVEAGTPRIQKLIGKHLNLKKVKDMIDACDKNYIHTRGFFMLGFPTETREEMMNTIQFAASSRLHTATFLIVIPFKGTPLFELYKDKIKAEMSGFENYDYTIGRFNMSEVSNEELFSLQRYANRKFFFNPLRILRTIRVHPRKMTLLLKVADILRLSFLNKINSLTVKQ